MRDFTYSQISNLINFTTDFKEFSSAYCNAVRGNKYTDEDLQKGYVREYISDFCDSYWIWLGKMRKSGFNDENNGDLYKVADDYFKDHGREMLKLSKFKEDYGNIFYANNRDRYLGRPFNRISYNMVVTKYRNGMNSVRYYANPLTKVNGRSPEATPYLPLRLRITNSQFMEALQSSFGVVLRGKRNDEIPICVRLIRLSFVIDLYYNLSLLRNNGVDVYDLNGRLGRLETEIDCFYLGTGEIHSVPYVENDAKYAAYMEPYFVGFEDEFDFNYAPSTYAYFKQECKIYESMTDEHFMYILMKLFSFYESYYGLPIDRISIDMLRKDSLNYKAFPYNDFFDGLMLDENGEEFTDAVPLKPFYSILMQFILGKTVRTQYQGRYKFQASPTYIKFMKYIVRSYFLNVSERVNGKNKNNLKLTEAMKSDIYKMRKCYLPTGVLFEGKSVKRVYESVAEAKSMVRKSMDKRNLRNAKNRFLSLIQNNLKEGDLFCTFTNGRQIRMETLNNIKKSAYGSEAYKKARSALIDEIKEKYTDRYKDFGTDLVDLVSSMDDPTSLCDTIVSRINLDFHKRFMRKLMNMKNRYGVHYIVIPERHESGFVHYHGFLLNYPKDNHKFFGPSLNAYTGEPMKDRSGRPIYDIIPFTKTFGWSTATLVDGSPKRAVGYACKQYVTKGAQSIFDKFFYCSQGLDRPTKTYYRVDPLSGTGEQVNEESSAELIDEDNYDSVDSADLENNSVDRSSLITEDFALSDSFVYIRNANFYHDDTVHDDNSFTSHSYDFTLFDHKNKVYQFDDMSDDKFDKFCQYNNIHSSVG